MTSRADMTAPIDELENSIVGRFLFFSRKIDSTNSWAERLVAQGATEGTVVMAETQNHARGRLGRRWVSPPGGLWFSVILTPSLNSKEAAKLTFVGGLAVAEALNELYGLRTETKWPNDVLVNGRKICGILGEQKILNHKVAFIILGIGINVNINTEKVFPASFRSSATSIQDELDRKVRLRELLITVLKKLDRYYMLFIAGDFDSVLEKWKKYATFLNREIVVNDREEVIRGTACDVSNEGALVLSLNDGSLKQIFVGDVTLGSHRNV